jgi:predicted nucleic acid-binding protein
VIIIDTNVLSELMRPAPAASVESWIGAQPPTSLFITTITQAELLYGIALLAPGKQRRAFAEAVAGMFEEDFADRILPFDAAAARAYATVAAERRQAGKPITQFDAQIAAIARSTGAAIATRNASDFEGCGIPVVNPWQA